MFRHLRLAAVALLLIGGGVLLIPAPPEKTPVLLELFTSSGCSSCPAADKLLAEIDRRQPIPGARLIVMSEHVDYWNGPSWTDPFSSSACTERQQNYDTRLGVEAYTPQLIVDGRAAVVGNNWQKVAAAIQRAMGGEHIPIHLTATRDAGKAKLEVTAEAQDKQKKAAIFVALARDQAQTHVTGGENAGLDTSEVAVVCQLKQIGKMEAGLAFSKLTTLDLPAKSQTGDLRAIVFIRKADGSQTIGVDQVVF